MTALAWVAAAAVAYLAVAVVVAVRIGRIVRMRDRQIPTPTAPDEPRAQEPPRIVLRTVDRWDQR